MNNVKQTFGHRLREYLMNSSYLTWVLLGFAVSYMFFFIGPVFLNSAHMMQIFENVPRQKAIGGDLIQMISYGESLIADQTPYIINYYPPLASIFFSPLIALDFTTAFAITTLITIACYSFVTLFLPLLTSRERKISPLLVLVIVTGLFSYGFQFELERGQWNVIAIFFSLLSIWVFHYHHKYRYLAYALFSLSIQLKVYPVIFIVMFIRDWRDWKNNIKRALGLAAANLALLFVLGPQIFINYLEVLRAQIAQTVNPSIWIGNHSIRSFVEGFLGKLRVHNLVANDYSSLMQVALLALIVVCIFFIILKAYRDGRGGLNVYLLLACTIGALLIPSISHDYKLSILAAPVALFFYKCPFVANDNGRLQLVFYPLIFLFSIAYSSTLFSYTNKISIVTGYPRLETSSLLGNNLPALMVMLFTATAFSLLDKPGRQDTGRNI